MYKFTATAIVLIIMVLEIRLTLLEIIYKDDHMVAINKPHGLLVHKTALAKDATEFALQMLREQIGAKVYPAHRIDRKTSGVLLFALSESMNSQIQRAFSMHKIKKTYLAIVRGYTADAGSIDYPLKNDNGVVQEAITHFTTLQRTEVDVPSSIHKSSRYSLVKIEPMHGRMHQIRRHFAHIMHPIVGDRPHGCNKQNRLFKEKWNIRTMMLHAQSLTFQHPVSEKSIHIKAKPSLEFMYCKSVLGFQ
ncbi:MAG: pseudouridine synthase [Cyclobacteriaceae bacterium]